MSLQAIIWILYFVLGYWSTGKTIYANKILIGTGNAIFMQKLVMGVILGWILIPVAIIKSFIGSKN